MTDRDDRWVRLLALTTLTVVVVWILYLARYAILIVYVSALIAIGLSPLVRALENRRLVPYGTGQPPRWLAALLVYLALALVFVAVAATVLQPMVEQAQQLVQRLPSMIDEGQHFLVRHGLLPHQMSMGEVVRELSSTGTEAMSTILGTFTSALGYFFGAVVIVVLSFYMLNESGAFFRALIPFVPVERRPDVRSIADQVVHKVGAWMLGQLMLSAIIGGTTALGMGLMGLPYFYVLAVISAVGEFIPYAGPVLGAVPGIAIGFTFSWQTALVVAGFYLGQQQLENHVLVPKLMQHQVGLTPAVVIIAITVGSVLLGIAGAVLAVPTAAILQIGLQEIRPDGPRT